MIMLFVLDVSNLPEEQTVPWTLFNKVRLAFIITTLLEICFISVVSSCLIDDQKCVIG